MLRRSQTSGVALLTAIGLLFVFCMLGMAYVASMEIGLERTAFDLRVMRSRHMAEGGVQAAIGEIQAALKAGKPVSSIPAVLEIPFPVCRVDRSSPTGFSEHENRRGVAKVAIADESGKVNLKCAPPQVLQAILGVDAPSAQKIRDAAATPGRVASVDSLATEGFMSLEAAAAVPRQLLTVYSVADPAHPSAWLNVNAAPPEVLAAVLSMPLEAAKAVAAKRPFKSLADLGAAAGRDPASFAIKPAPETPTVLPKEFCFESRCFRIISEATLANLGPNGQEYRKTPSRVEAVVVFGPGEIPCITFWNEARRGADNEQAKL